MYKLHKKSMDLWTSYKHGGGRSEVSEISKIVQCPLVPLGLETDYPDGEMCK